MFSPEADQQGCGRPAHLDSIRGCRSSWCARFGGRVAPEPSGCRSRPPEGGWRSCAEECDWAGGELVARTVPSWNQIGGWLRELNLLRSELAAEPLANFL